MAFVYYGEREILLPGIYNWIFYTSDIKQWRKYFIVLTCIHVFWCNNIKFFSLCSCKKARQYSGGSTQGEGENIIIGDVEEEEEEGDEEENQQRPIYLLDCKEYVWSVAFGASQSLEDNTQSWKRMKINSCTLLATGLQSGRIKLWDCSTGQWVTLVA